MPPIIVMPQRHQPTAISGVWRRDDISWRSCVSVSESWWRPENCGIAVGFRWRRFSSVLFLWLKMNNVEQVFFKEQLFWYESEITVDLEKSHYSLVRFKSKYFFLTMSMVRGHSNFQIRSLLRIVHFSGGVGLKMKNFKNSKKNRYFQKLRFPAGSRNSGTRVFRSRTPKIRNTWCVSRTSQAWSP